MRKNGKLIYVIPNNNYSYSIYKTLKFKTENENCGRKKKNYCCQIPAIASELSILCFSVLLTILDGEIMSLRDRHQMHSCQGTVKSLHLLPSPTAYAQCTHCTGQTFIMYFSVHTYSYTQVLMERERQLHGLIKKQRLTDCTRSVPNVRSSDFDTDLPIASVDFFTNF